MSKAIDIFNGLNGVVATREQLKKIIVLAGKDEQTHIVNKLQYVLDNNEDKEFDISLVGMAEEIAPKSMLNGLHFEEFDFEENTGLNKAVSSNDIYQMITDKMLQMIKEATGKGYVKKWKGGTYGTGYTIPFNFDSKKRYRGVNVFLLTSFEPLENPFFMTFKQIETNKGKLKKASKGYPVIYFTNLYKITDKARNIDFGTYDLKKAKEYASKNGFNENDIDTLPILKYYNVFNGKDIEDIDFDLANFKIGFIENELPVTERLPIADAIVENYPKPAPIIKHGGNEAYHRGEGVGLVQMPHIADFDTAQDYYRTLFHELAHSTGSPDRMNRKLGNKFGSKDYAFEELIAEWGATFLSAEAGIIFHTNKNHAEYIKGWNNALVHLKDDNKFIMKACTLAQKLTDFILQFDENGTPLYLKNLKVENAKIEVKKTTKTKSNAQSKKKSVNKVGKDIKENKKNTSSVAKSKKQPVVKQKTIKREVISSKYQVNDSVVWEGKKVTISKLAKIGNDTKFELNLGKNKTIWTDENTLNFEAKKPIKKEKDNFWKDVTTNSTGLLPDFSKPKIYKKPVKVEASGQTALFGVKGKQVTTKTKKHSKISKIALAGNDQESEFYTVAGEVGKFLQQVERKPVESVVITLDGQQGAGKTTTLYKFMDSFAITGNKCLFLSLEEHPASSLAKTKVNDYLTAKAQDNIDSVGEVESITELYDFVQDYDIVFIDSWQKLQRMVGAIRLDEDLRKKFDGKVFVVIFQQTTTGRTKGGAEVVFDGDIIIKMVKENSFADNYAYFDKNRYTKIPIENIRYNIASGTVYNPNAIEEPATELQPVENVEFGFVVE